MYFQEIESKVEDHKPKVESTLKKGTELSNGDHLVPDIVTDQLETLERLWKKVSELLSDKKRDLEEYQEQWKNYVNELEKVMGKLGKNETFLNENVSDLKVSSEESAKEQLEKYKVNSAVSLRFSFILD